MKIKSYLRVMFVACLISLLSIGFSTTIYAGEFLEAAVGAEVLEGVEREALESAAKEAFEGTLGTDLPSLNELPKEVTEELKSNLSKFVEENKALLETPEGIKEVGSKLESQLKSSFGEFKTEVTGYEGKFTPEQIDALGKFKGTEGYSPKEINNIRALKEGPRIDVPEGLNVPAEAVPTDPAQTLVDARGNALGEFKSKIDEFPEAKTADEIKNANKSLNESQTKVNDAQEKLSKARDTEVTTAKEDATNAEGERIESESKFDEAQKGGDKEKVKNAKEKVKNAKEEVEDKKKIENKTKEEDRQKEIQNSKKQYSDAKDNWKNADDRLTKVNKALDDLEGGPKPKGKFEGVEKGSDEYNELKSNLEEAKTDAENQLGKAKDDYADARRRYKETAKATRNLKQRFKDKVFSVGKSIGEQLFIALIFMAPGWMAQAVTEAMNKKALRDTLKKIQQWGNIHMTLPRCFINENNPSASFYMYVGIEESKLEVIKKHPYNGDEEYLTRANYYVAAPEYGEWASVAITDPSFPDVMAHLNTGFVFDGDGAPADENCTSPQLIGIRSKLSVCRQPVTQDELNKLSGPVAAGATGYEAITEAAPVPGEEATGYKGSVVISTLLDGSKNPDWQKNYPDVDASLKYGSMLNAAIGVFRGGPMSSTPVGNFQLSELQGLKKKLAEKTGNPQAEGAPKMPYVAKGLWIYQTKDTPQVKTVIEQLHAKGKTDLASLVWDYIVALDNNGKVISLHEVQPGDNNFQHYTFNPHNTTVKFLCSLLQPGVVDKQPPPFQIYELDGDEWKSSKEVFTGAFKDYDKLFKDNSRVHNQVKLMHGFIETRVVSGPFTVGSKQLEISQDLLDANIPIYKVTGFLADGSDDYVVVTSGEVCLKLPDASQKFIWSLVTSRIYQAGNFAPFTKIWYARIKGDGSDALPYKIGFKPSEGGKFHFPVPLYSVIMPQDVNPNIVTYKKEKMRIPAPDLYAAKILKFKAGDDPEKYPTIRQVLSADDAPEAAKKVWKAINNSFVSWKGFLEAVDDEQKGAVDDSIKLKTWVKDLVPPLELSATSEADIFNGFYVYQNPGKYPGQFLVMAPSSKKMMEIGREFNNTSPQQYLFSLSTGTVYDNKNEGKFAHVPPLDPIALWKQVQKNTNWPGKLQTWQQQMTTLQGRVKTLKGDDLTKAQSELKMLQKLLGKVPDPINPKEQVSQAQANFNRLDAAIKKSQKTFGVQVKAQQYGDNLFGPFSFFINKKDLQHKAYFYQDVTDIKDPMKNLDANGNVKGVTGLYVCGQKQKDGSVFWGYQLDGNTDRVLNLITGAVFSRGGFQGTYAKFTESFNSASEKKNPQILIDNYLNLVLKEIKVKFGAILRPELKTAIQKLLEPQYKLLEKEKQETIKQETEEKTKYASMDANLRANLKSAKYLAAYSTFAQQHLKKYAGKYYLVPKHPVSKKDGAGKIVYVDEIVSYTDYNVGVKGKDNNVGATYDPKGTMLVRVTGWALENMRAKVGVIVNAKGTQSLAIGVDQPMIPMKNMVKLATIQAGGPAKAEDVALKTEVDHAVTVVNTEMEAVKKSPQDKKARQRLLQASADLALKKLMYRSAKMLSIAIKNNYIKPAKKGTYEYYFNSETGSHFGKLIFGNKSYYLELASGLTYDITGVPRIRKETVFVDKKNKKALTWFEGNTIHRQLLVILPTSITGKQYDVYRATVVIPPSTYTPKVGQPAVTYQGKEAIQQQCTSITNLDDDKQVVTNNYIGGKIKKVTFMDVWDVAKTKAGDHLTELGLFEPAKGQYFAHLIYIQTRKSGQASGLFDPKNVNKNDDISTVMVWDGGSDLKLQQVYYQYQFITLTASGRNIFTGSYTGTGGKSHPITVTKEQRLLTTGKGPQMVAMWISIKDGNKIIDYHYDTSIIEQDNMNKLKGMWSINVVTDAYGQSRLSVKFISLKRGIKVANVPKDQQEIINKVVANVGFDSAAGRFLYQLTTSKAKAYGLESYEDTMNTWYVDMATGVLFNTDYYPSGKALHASDMSKLMNNIQLGITYDKEGIPIGLHYRTVTDLDIIEKKQTAKAK